MSLSYFSSVLEFYDYLGIDGTFDFISGRKFKPKVSINTEAKHEEKKVEKHNDITIDNSTLEVLKEEVLKNCNCKLKTKDRNTVIGDGNTKAEILLIGEGPGEEEDRCGIPFCGKSGKLLGVALGTIGISRDSNLFITNTVFWRPPNNRKPEQDEIDTCRPYLNSIIDFIDPKFIILCGSTSANEILQNNDKMSNLIGRIFDYKHINRTIPCMAIYHPSYMLRNPISKKTVWENLLTMKNFLDENVPNWKN